MTGIAIDAALQLLAAVRGVSDARVRAEGRVVVFDCRIESPDVADALAPRALTAGRLLALETKHPSLEDRFIAAVTHAEVAAS